MKIIIETDGATTKCEVDNKNIKDCDVLTKRLVFNAFAVIINQVFIRNDKRRDKRSI